MWLDRLPARFAEAAPWVVPEREEGFWVCEGRRVPTTGLGASAGRDLREFTTKPLRFDEMRPGCYDSAARLADMDVDGVASLCFCRSRGSAGRCSTRRRTRSSS